MQQQIIGLETLPKWLRDKFRSAVDFCCQGCNRYEDEIGMLQIHRIKRGNVGGLYTVVPLNDKHNNCKVLCDYCHKKYHSNEWRNCQSK